MDAATRDYLARLAADLGQPLSGVTVDKLDRYYELLCAWNAKVNLTSVVAPRAVVELHFVDSLSVLGEIGEAETVIDVGAGAGFPGAVIALVRSDLRVLCLEAVQKKVSFMKAVQREIVPNIEPVWGRLEKFLEGGRTFDAAVSRAVWEPQEWVNRGASLVKPGGRLIAMQGSEQPTLIGPVGFRSLPERAYFAGSAARRLVVFARE